MKDIQEKRIEKELYLLENCPYFYRISKKINKEEMYIDLIYNTTEEEEQEKQKPIIFVIHLVANYPFNTPRVFCKSPVSLF
jgi:ubiquitin-protein ligase